MSFCPRGEVSFQEGVFGGQWRGESLSGGGGLCPGGSLSETPVKVGERAVRILLECILVNRLLTGLSCAAVCPSIRMYFMLVSCNSSAIPSIILW